jgi:GNAT superfamily N-acetyltransferase
MTPARPAPRIVHLIDAPPVTAETLAGWYVAEWAPWYGPDGDGDARADLAACADRDVLPICLVAIGPDDMLKGCAALRAESVGSELGVGPWLAGILVAEAHRGRGIGAALVEAIATEARRLGHAAIHASTDAPEAAMVRRGWQRIGAAQSLRGPVAVYRRPVGEAPDSQRGPAAVSATGSR